MEVRLVANDEANNGYFFLAFRFRRVLVLATTLNRNDTCFEPGDLFYAEDC